ncbi:MAG TPA: hypothetical protein VHG89_04845 [Verrucomicrobiae bacterium]|nr:hypothetical protein [Verrucomicrobiae bacterium]
MSALFSIASNAKSYGNAIARYADETGKSFADALTREAPDFRMELFRQFRAIRPARGSIAAAAKARGYRVARLSSTTLVPTEAGLSQRAINRARTILDGQKSDLFRAGLGGNLRPVRFGARGSHRVLLGGRTGFRFSKSALRAYQLTAKQLAASLNEPMKYGAGEVSALKGMSIVRLNLRALAVYLELLYRERGAGGGAMAVQWLFKTWKSGSQHSQLVQRSATGILMGTVDFDFDAAGNLQTVTFTGYVPGSATEAEKHGLLDKVFAARQAGLSRAIVLHQQKVAQRYGL